MKLHVYLDTTVVSAAEDARAPDRQQKTLAFFARADEFELATSALTREEVLRTIDAEKRNRLLERLQLAGTFPLTDEMHRLADNYVEAGIIPGPYRDDALHVAAAVLSGQDVLVSRNFRHLVNRRRRAMINLLNASRGLPTIEILTPAEL